MAGKDSVFSNRERDFEGRFALDQEQEFKARARRNRLLGLWAAEHFGLAEKEAAEYAREIIRADLEEEGDEDVFRKLRGDFDQRGVECSDRQIRRQIEELHAKAREEIAKGI